MLRRLAFPALVLLVAACSSSDGSGPDTLNLTGSWRQSGDLRSAATGDTLIPIGTFDLVQSGDSFSGEGQQAPGCTASVTQAGSSHDSPIVDLAPVAISGGTLGGRTVTFARDICTYEGSFVEGRNDRITGTATCAYTRNNVAYTFTGQWQATKN
jgi:hypothetical protein